MFNLIQFNQIQFVWNFNENITYFESKGEKIVQFNLKIWIKLSYIF